MDVEYEPPSGSVLGVFRAIDWGLVACVLGAMALCGSASILVAHNYYGLAIANSDTWVIALLSMGLLLPLVTSWVVSVHNRRLSILPGGQPRRDHISGWGAVFLTAVVAMIIAVVVWAARSDDASRKIHTTWGLWVVGGLAVAFVVAALAPVVPRLLRAIGLDGASSFLFRMANAVIAPFGRLLSHVDGFLVFAVAGSVGADKKSWWVRYALLIASIGACATLAYLLPPPLSFLPLAWAFLQTISISRRWIWIEEDRERAMLNPKLARSQARVGFEQDLRDEALVSFMFLFLLVPIGLRAAQLFAASAGYALFNIESGVNIHDLRVWIGYYGTELAKAVPFVDWAEVYDVTGDAPIEAVVPMSLHLVFATRVLIDLVFLAALLQAISIASRDAMQRDLFYVKRELNHLDPFTEPSAFRSLVRRKADGGWEKAASFGEFPVYNADRLIELSAHRDEQIRVAAELLIQRDNVGGDPHFSLSTAAADSRLNAGDMLRRVDEVRRVEHRNIYQLDLARRRLLARSSMARVRREIVELMAEAPYSREKVGALIDVLIGDVAERVFDARDIALTAIAGRIAGDERVRAAIRHAAERDGHRTVRNHARRVLDDNPDVA